MKYVAVVIDGLPDTITALNDSVCQLCVVGADTIRSLNLLKLEQAELKGLLDELVLADIVRIRVRLTTGRKFVNVTCVVVEKQNQGSRIRTVPGTVCILFFEGYVRPLTYSILAYVNKNRIRNNYTTQYFILLKQ